MSAHVYFSLKKISKIRTSVNNLEGEDNPSPDFLVLYSLDIYGIIIFKNHGMTIWYCFIAVVALFLILNHKFAQSLTNEYLGNRSCTWAYNSYVFPFHKNSQWNDLIPIYCKYMYQKWPIIAMMLQKSSPDKLRMLLLPWKAILFLFIL